MLFIITKRKKNFNYTMIIEFKFSRAKVLFAFSFSSLQSDVLRLAETILYLCEQADIPRLISLVISNISYDEN